MTLVPQSLFGRLFAALVGVIVITLLLIVLLIVRERRDLAFLGTGAWNTTKAIAETSETLANLSGSERTAAIENLRQHPLVLEDLRSRRPVLRPEELRAMQSSFAAQLRRQLGPGYRVVVERASRSRTPEVIHVEGARRVQARAAVQAAREADALAAAVGDAARPGDAGAPGDAAPGDAGTADAGPGDAPDATDAADSPARAPSDREVRANRADRAGRPRPGRNLFLAFMYDVTVTLPDGQNVMFRAVAPLPAPPLPSAIFVELAVLTVMLGIALFFMALTITRPLRELATAADAVGRGAYNPPLAEKGARELRQATRAFNIMQERLRRYLESRTRVLAAMSHDLRTTLTRLRLRAESIDNDELRVRFSADLDEMAQMVQGALGLFKDLNDQEPPESIDLDALLANLQADFKEMDADITIQGHTDGPISAKPLALKRCLMNLLHNAIKYGTRATVLVSDGENVVIRIRDEGPGIPEEALDQVFEPFFRIDASRNRDTGGAGLGLSIARDIAQAHGGSITLRNLPTGGLEAVLTLPRAATAATPAESRSGAAAPAAPSSSIGSAVPIER
ncbi:MAG TPA: ATP-binding protein [Steroidobacteraceae bacterium]|nr:ATP-binding protein [Steroidobacteraceae bacterium]